VSCRQPPGPTPPHLLPWGRANAAGDVDLCRCDLGRGATADWGHCAGAFGLLISQPMMVSRGAYQIVQGCATWGIFPAGLVLSTMPATMHVARVCVCCCSRVDAMHCPCCVEQLQLLQVYFTFLFSHDNSPPTHCSCHGAEETFDAAMQALVARGYLGPGQLVALVMSGRKPIWRSASTHSIQVGFYRYCYRFCYLSGLGIVPPNHPANKRLGASTAHAMMGLVSTECPHNPKCPKCFNCIPFTRALRKCLATALQAYSVPVVWV